MRKRLLSEIIATALLTLLTPVMVNAQSERVQVQPPPIGQPLAREGTFAVNLVNELGISTTESETEAESLLGSAGIAPRNGWIADYPVTPDIVGEVQQAVSDAVDSGRLEIGKDEAMKSFEDVAAELDLPVRSYIAGERCEAPPYCENYPNPGVINDYYSVEGPPIVTYYSPPPTYYYLYAWVPYPFWWSGFWFSGFFVLHDFHKVVIVKNKVTIITNHFSDLQTHRAFRIDPASRFTGRTFAGIGAPRTGGFISTGIPRSSDTIFNHTRRLGNASRSLSPSPGSGSMANPPPIGNGSVTKPSGGRSSLGGMHGR